MNDLVTLEEQIQVQPGTDLVSLTDGEKFTVDEKTAQARASKANFALGETSPGEQSIYAAIASGAENDFRRQVAVQQDVVKNAQRIRKLDEMARNPNIGPNELALIQSLSQPEKETSPESVLEEMYGRSFIKNTVESQKDTSSVFSKAELSNPQMWEKEKALASDIIAKKKIIETVKEDFQGRYQDTGWGKTASDILEQFVPGLSMVRSWGINDGTNSTEATLTGDVLKEKVENLWLLPPDEMAVQYKQAVTELADKNIYDAAAFVQAMENYGKNAAFVDNAFAALDISDIALMGVGTVAKVAKAARGAGRVAETASELAAREARLQARKALGDAVNASDIALDRVEDIHAAVGDVSKAAEIGAMRKVSQVGDDTVDVLEETKRTLPSAFRHDSIVSNPGTLAREATDRLATALKHTEEVMVKLIDDPMRVGRLTPAQQEVAIKEAKAVLERDFNHVNDSIIDIRADNIDVNAANIQTVTMELGAPNATPFPTEDLARFYGEQLYGIPEFNVAQKGGSFVIEVKRAVDETSEGVRNALVQTNQSHPESLMEHFIDFLKNPSKVLPDAIRGADELLSKSQNENRKAAEFGFSETMRLMKELVQPIAGLTKKEKKDFEAVLRYNRNWMNPATGERGFFYKTVGDLEDGYMERVGRLPSAHEIEAYFKQVQLYNLDWNFRNLSLYREKSRAGLKRFNFEYKSVDAEGKPVYKSVGDFEGKEVDGIPWTTAENATVMVYDEASQSASTFLKNGYAQREAIDEMLKNGGYRVIQIDAPTSRPFKDLLGSNEIVRFAIVRKFDKKELAYKQLNYNPGGHVEYQHPWFIKQPKVTRGQGGQAFYEGDMTVFNFANQAQARKFEKAMNEARQMLKAKDDAALAAYLPKNLPYTVDQFKALFAETKLADGTVEAATLDINTPFHVIKRGRKVGDDVDLKSQYPNLKDYTASDYDLSGEINRKYVGARSGPLMTISEKGSDANPLFNLTPAPLVDPLPTLGRALSNAANNRYLGDYKISAVEDWISKYGDVLRVDRNDLMRNPMYHLHNPQWDMNVENTWKLQEAMSARSAILNLAGNQTMLGRKIENLKQKLYNSVYSTFGESTANKIVDLTDNGLGGMRDPATFMRGVAFHAKLGLFNPIQLFTQAQGLVNIMALSPKQGAAAAAAYWPTRVLFKNPSPENIAHVAEKMVKLGWKKEDYIESVTALMKSGWAYVGKEHAWRDDLADPVTFNKGGNFFINKGTVFFEEGERVIRLTSWNTAYREWKAANPDRSFNRAAQRWVMDRADLLSVNMTRASQAAIQKGVFSIPTQFMGYQMRLMDQFLGKRLTTSEKLRLFGAYSLMYGVPTAGGAAFMYPFYDDVRTSALERGVEGEAAVKVLTEGVPSLLLGMIHGEDFNVASRYGPGGIRLGDKEMMEIIVGASGSVIGDMIKSTVPLAGDIYELMKEGGRYEPVMQDVIDATRNVSTANQAVKTLMALNTGKYFSRNGNYLTDMTDATAIFSGITGLEPLKLSDAYLKAASNKNLKALENEARKEYTRYTQRGFEEFAAGNREAAEAWWKKARAVTIWADLNPQKQGDFFKDSTNGYEDMVDRINQSFVKNAPASQAQARQDALTRQGK